MRRDAVRIGRLRSGPGSARGPAPWDPMTCEVNSDEAVESVLIEHAATFRRRRFILQAPGARVAARQPGSAT